MIILRGILRDINVSIQHSDSTLAISMFFSTAVFFGSCTDPSFFISRRSRAGMFGFCGAHVGFTACLGVVCV